MCRNNRSQSCLSKFHRKKLKSALLCILIYFVSQCNVNGNEPKEKQTCGVQCKVLMQLLLCFLNIYKVVHVRIPKVNFNRVRAFQMSRITDS